ncbi:ABC transporter substrate-binding protein [Siculibacillus lacustris]|uniref:ABC transporter substrate-binding protein n=1 Tax=Siculibacillus lacustris TaxID=1549641 RepID=A0A4Q9VTG4_9HYPH|nr:ABC transporter substrate-binding protein [Siculibacillus lacustris]TBW38256.1 ABC transporter substrate-binding protein [Siculibacillus lacustris]
MPRSSLSLSRRGLLASAAGLGVAALAGRSGFAATPTAGGVLRYATLGLDTSDPHRHTGSIAVQQCYVEALTSIAADGSVEPFLAERFTVSPDGRNYRFELRPGVTFHNGDPLTAADVVANIERVKSKVKGGWLASAMKLVDGAAADGPNVVTLSLSKPYAPLLNLFSELWILSPKSDGWAETIKTPIGTGPFTFGTWVPKVKLTAPAYRNYWRSGEPHLSAIEFDLGDGTDKALALRAGDLHVANVERDTVEALVASGKVDIKALKDTAWFSIAFNNRKPRPPFDDPRVRSAIALAVDKAAIMKFVGGAEGVVTNQLVAPGNVYFDQALHDADPFAKPDLAKAKALLAEARVKPEDHTIEFVSWVGPYPQIVVQMVRKLGFKVNHVALDDIGAQKRLGQYDWDMNAMSSGPRADLFLRWVRLMTDGPNPVLWGGIQDAELDRTITAAVEEPDLARRKAIYLDATRRVAEKVYFVVLGHAPDLVAVAKTVQGYEPGFTWACHWASGGVARAALVAA